MLSRVAENVYWMGRYIERAENTARLVSVNTNLLMDLPRGIAPGWAPLITIVGMDQGFYERHAEANERNVVKFLIGDRNNPNSILSVLHMARENCRTVRELVPRSGWELINELYLYAKENVNTGVTKRDRHEYLSRIIAGSQAINGLLASVMNRDEAYRFLQIGRNMERADMTTRIIDVRSTDLLPDDAPEMKAFDTIQWVSVLNSLSAYQAYRRTVQMQVSRTEVLEFLFKSTKFPRAVLHCLNVVEESLGDLTNHEKPLRKLRSLMRKASSARMESLRKEQLHQFIDDLQLGIIQLHQVVAEFYFLPPPESAAADAA